LCFIAHLYKANGGTDMEVLGLFRPCFSPEVPYSSVINSEDSKIPPDRSGSCINSVETLGRGLRIIYGSLQGEGGPDMSIDSPFPFFSAFST